MAAGDSIERDSQAQGFDFHESIPKRALIDPELQKVMLAMCLQPTESGFGVDGSELSFYFDLDYFGAPYTSIRTIDIAPRLLPQFMDQLSDTVANAVSPNSERADALVFLKRNSGGPVGMIAARASLIEKMRTPSLVVDPHRRILAGQIKPWPITPDIKPVLVMDMTATGEEVFDTVEPLSRAGLKGIRVVTLFDTNEGAREKLALAHIPLTVIMSVEDMVTAA